MITPTTNEDEADAAQLVENICKAYDHRAKCLREAARREQDRGLARIVEQYATTIDELARLCRVRLECGEPATETAQRLYAWSLAHHYTDAVVQFPLVKDGEDDRDGD